MIVFKCRDLLQHIIYSHLMACNEVARGATLTAHCICMRDSTRVRTTQFDSYIHIHMRALAVSKSSCAYLNMMIHSMLTIRLRSYGTVAATCVCWYDKHSHAHVHISFGYEHFKRSTWYDCIQYSNKPLEFIDFVSPFHFTIQSVRNFQRHIFDQCNITPLKISSWRFQPYFLRQRNKLLYPYISQKFHVDFLINLICSRLLVFWRFFSLSHFNDWNFFG